MALLALWSRKVPKLNSEDNEDESHHRDGQTMFKR